MIIDITNSSMERVTLVFNVKPGCVLDSAIKEAMEIAIKNWIVVKVTHNNTSYLISPEDLLFNVINCYSTKIL